MDAPNTAAGVVRIGDENSSNKISTIRDRIQQETERVKKRAAASAATGSRSNSTTSDRGDKAPGKVKTKKKKKKKRQEQQYQEEQQRKEQGPQHIVELVDEETKEEAAVVVFENQTKSLQEMAKRLQEENSRVKSRRRRRQVRTIKDDGAAEASTSAATEVIIEKSNIPFQLPGAAGGTATIDYSVVVSSSTPAAAGAATKASPLEYGEKSVTFTTLEIRLFPLCLGDNPAGVQGAPISIDWDHIEEVTTTVDDYETHRADPTRMSSDLRTTWELRWYRLCQAGYSESEIMDCIEAVDEIRLRRMRTNNALLLSGVHFFFERIRRGIKNATVGRDAKLLEREYSDYWRQIHEQQLDEYGYMF